MQDKKIYQPVWLIAECVNYPAIDELTKIYIKQAIKRKYKPSEATMGYYERASKHIHDKEEYIQYQFMADYQSQIFMYNYVYKDEGQAKQKQNKG